LDRTALVHGALSPAASPHFRLAVGRFWDEKPRA
jgi:hypothetical protein